MNIQLIIAGVFVVAGFSTGFGTAWKIQDYSIVKAQNKRIKEEADRDRQTYETVLESQRLAFRAQTAMDKRLIDAQNAAALRNRVLRDDADRLRVSLAGLSHDSAESLSRARSSHAACLVSAAAHADVFGKCSGEYRALAEKADRHTNDIKTLTEACNGRP